MNTIRNLAVGLAALGSTALAGSFLAAAPATAGVSVGIGIGVPGPAYYGTYGIRTGRCRVPRFAFNHPGLCGYPRFSEPVFIDGIWVNEPLYYRTYGGVRYFWYNGGWRAGHGSWDGRRFEGDWHRTWHERGWDRDDWRRGGRDHDRDDMRVRDRDRDDMHDRDRDRDNMHDRDRDRDRDNMRDRDDRRPHADRDRDDRRRDRDNENNDNDHNH
jgi:hypothetical protein